MANKKIFDMGANASKTEIEYLSEGIATDHGFDKFTELMIKLACDAYFVESTTGHGTSLKKISTCTNRKKRLKQYAE